MERILADYRALLAEVDAWFARCMAQAGDRIACRQGCAGCCRGLFDITLPDAWLLRQGFGRLPAGVQAGVLARARARLAGLQERWPGFAHPWRLADLPEDEIAALQEADETPCVLLGADGLCLVYEHRPLTCRLHGLPHIDLGGDVFTDEWCTRNFPGVDPLALPELRWEFRRLFVAEGRLLRAAMARLTGRPDDEFDTFIPTALLIDFDRPVD